MLITLYKIGGVYFRLLGKNGFRVKAKSERFTAASSRCHQNLKYENFTSSFGRLRQNIAPKSVPHVQHDYFSSFNQLNHWFVALTLTLTLSSSNLKLPIDKGYDSENHDWLCALVFFCSDSIWFTKATWQLEKPKMRRREFFNVVCWPSSAMRSCI